MHERAYPKLENLGRNCLYWQVGGLATACCFPKAELEGRRSCEGLIDDVCLFMKDGTEPTSLTDEQIASLKTTLPTSTSAEQLPPGDIPAL